jgi:hypothetical protein
MTLTVPPNAFPPNVNVDMGTVKIQYLQGLNEKGEAVDITYDFTNLAGQAIPPLPLESSGDSYIFTFKAKDKTVKSAITNLLVLVTYEGDLR